MTRPLVLLALGLGLATAVTPASARPLPPGGSVRAISHHQGYSNKTPVYAAKMAGGKKGVKAKKPHARAKTGGWNRVKNHP